MTANQIAYWNYKEAKRHNIEVELDADLARAETIRHNYAYEQETQRHNLAAEGQARLSYAESVRHNQAVELLEAYRLTEEQRANQAREEETHRHNLATEYNQRQNDWWDYLNESRRNDINEFNADTSRASATADAVLGAMNAVSNLMRSASSVTDSISSAASKFIPIMGG